MCARAPPRMRKILLALFTGVSCKCTPRKSKSPIFEEIFAGRRDLEGGGSS